jgi:hypothetical protein
VTVRELEASLQQFDEFVPKAASGNPLNDAGPEEVRDPHFRHDE